MTPQSHAQQLLVALYRGVLGRARRLRAAWSLEPLPPRRLMSVTPVGGETLVNPTTSGTQSYADVTVSSGGVASFVWENSGSSVAAPANAIRADGRYILTWVASNDIHAQFYNSDGTPFGSEFIANDYTSGTQKAPDVAMNATGDFVITWEGQGSGDSDGVWARQFAPDGTPLAGEFRVNGATSSKQHAPAVAMADDGSFFIAFADDDSGKSAGAQYFNSAGTGQGALLVHVGDEGGRISVADNGSGTFVVAYSAKISGDFYVHYRRYSGGTAIDGSGVIVDAAGAEDNQENTAVAMDSAGNFIVAWDEKDRDGSGFGIYARRVLANGSFDGAAFRVNTTTSNDQHRPAISMTPGGTAIVVWDGNGPGDSAGIFKQQYSTTSTPNQAPVNTVPGSQTIAEDTSIVFSSANGNAISVSDPDAGSLPVQVTLSVTSGALTLASLSGLTFTAGDGIADSTMTFNGTLGAINTALNGLNFTPAANASGAVNLTIVTNDLGNTGSGGAQSDTDGVSINVTAVNDAPVNSMPSPQSVAGGGVLNFGGGSGVPISVSDVDAGSAPLEVTLSVSVGTLSLATTSGLTFSQGDGNADGSMVFQGSQAAINAALDGMSYNAPLILLSNPEVSITTDDLGNTGAGGALSDSDTLFLNSSSANQPPVLNLPPAQVIDEDANLIFSTAGGNAVSIDDPDAGTGELEVTLASSQGKLTLSGITGLTFTTGDGSGDAMMVFTGTLADINNALQGLIFTPTTNYNGSGSISIAVDDQGNTGSGGAESDSGSIGLTINAVNDPPVLNLASSSESINEDTPRVFSVANGNLISISDVDAASSALEVRLTATNGTLTLSGTSGLSFTGGDGSGDATMTFTGTLSAINAALAGMSFTPDPDFAGGAQFQIEVDDQGNTGSGGQGADSGLVSINVAGVNDAPVNSLPPAQSTIEETPLVLSTGNGNAISIDDIDAGSSAILQVTLSASNGELTLAGLTGLTFSTGDGNDDTTMTFTGTAADINAALDGLVFSPNPNFAGAASVTIVTSDQGGSGSGGVRSDTDTLNIAVNGVNDGPVLTVPGSAQAVNEDAWLIFNSGNGNLISIADIDSGSGSLEVTLTATNGIISLSGTSGLTFTAGDGVMDATMTFTGTLAAINAALAGMSFRGDANYNGSASIQVDVSDQGNTGTGGALTDSASVAINIAALNDAPVNTVPTARTMNEDATLVFSSANGNAISITDVDAGSGLVEVSLTSTNGTLTLSDVTGLTFSTGDGTDDASMVFTGSVADINAALNGLAFVPNSDFNGSASVAIVTTDQGNSGAGGAQSDSDSVAVTVNAVNDAPVNTIPSAQNTDEDVALVFSATNGNAITVADVDASTLRVWLHATGGVLTLSTTSGLTFTMGNGTGDADMIFQGTKAAIDAALDGLTFDPTSQTSGPATIQVQTSDLGSTGSGGTKTDTDTINITIDSVNDAPTITVPSPKSTRAGLWSTFSSANNNAITIDDADAGNNPVEVTLTATAGTISLASTSGLTFSVGWGAMNATMTFTGSIDDINAALDGMSFAAANGNPTVGGIQITVSDQGNTGGPAQTASANVVIEIVSEFRVNTSTNANQQVPSVAMDPAGNYVVVWSSNHLSNNYGIWAQRYDSFGAPIGGELHLNTTVSNTQTAPVVAIDASGNFVAVWASNATGDWEIIARRFSFATGDPLGAEIVVNQTSAGNQQQPAIALAPDGQFLVTWRGDASGRTDVFARLFNANGTPAGGQFVVNVNTTNTQDQPAVAADASGNFVIVWRSVAQDGSGAGVFGRRYNAAGVAQGGEFQANVNASGDQDKPNVAMSWNGAFVVSWTSGNNHDGSGKGIYARLFDAAGNPVAGEFRANTTTTGDQDVSSVSMDSAGVFTIAWASNGQDGSGRGVYGQKYDAAGAPIGGEFRISGTTYGNQDQPAVAMSAASDLIVVWHGNGLGDDSGVFGQFWRSNNHVPIHSVPSGMQTTAEESALYFSAVNGNQISISSFSPSLRVSLVATHGLMSLATTAGLTFTAGDGSIDAAMTFTGSLSAINAALATLRFDPDLNYNGPAEIRITTTDSTTGTPVTDEDTIDITITPVNDTPTTTGLSDVTVDEDAADTHVGLLAKFSDIENLASELAYTISGNTNAALFDSISVDPLTHDLVLNYAANANGSATITLRATDSGGLFVEATFAVTVNPVNDDPTLVLNTGASIHAGETLVVTTAMLQIVDIDNTSSQLVYTITSLPAAGVLQLGGVRLVEGDSFTQADIDAGRVTYSQAGRHTVDEIAFGVSDASGGGAAAAAFGIDIDQPPEAPLPPPGMPVTPPLAPDPLSSATDVTTTDQSSTPAEAAAEAAAAPIPSVPSSSGGGSGSSTANGTAATPPQAPTDAAATNNPAGRGAEAAQPEVARPQNNVEREQFNIGPAEATPPPVPAPIAPAPVAIALPPPPPAQAVAFIAKPDGVITQQLDELRKEVTNDAPVLQLVAGGAKWASLSLSVVYVLWTIRAGYLLASLLSSMPAWSFVDPLPILDHFDDPNDPDRKRRRGKDPDEDDESLQNLVDRSNSQTESNGQGELS